MAGKPLPVINFAPFRKYPAKLVNQEYENERQVCGNCLSGACCTTEDPIYLTSFDVFRLSAFFDISPADFLLRFTQESFDGEDSEATRRPWIDDPASSKVTYLRRRANTPISPCIFLKYIIEPDGTPRRICSVHEARPLSCREFYFEHCKTRVTGEMASLLAEGYELVRDGLITEELVAERLSAFDEHDESDARVSATLEYTFWVEMKRVLSWQQANVEGSNTYRMASYQDPIDDKLNRILSARYLRFEEAYGFKPNGEQLMPYTAGLTFAASTERARIMKLLRERPSSGLFERGDFPFRAAMRMMVRGVQHPETFQTIPERAITDFLENVPPDPLFPNHLLPEARSVTHRQAFGALLRGFNHLIRFNAYVAAMGNLLEGEPQGVLETNLLETLARFEGNDAYLAHSSYFQPVKEYLGSQTIGLVESLFKAARKPSDFFAVHRSLCRLRPALKYLPTELRARFETISSFVLERLRRNSLELYVRRDNPVAARRIAGKRLDVPGAWATWERQALDLCYAEMAGFEQANLTDFYRHSIDELEKIPFRRSYCARQLSVINNLSQSMTRHNSAINKAEVGRSLTESAARLASYTNKLFGWMDSVWGYENLDSEIIAGLYTVIRRGANLEDDYNHTCGLLLHRLLSNQLPDGSWETDPAGHAAEEWQVDYLYKLYSVTSACLDGLTARAITGMRAGNAATRFR